MDNHTIEIPIKFAVRLVNMAIKVDPYGVALGPRAMLDFQLAINEALNNAREQHDENTDNDLPADG